MSKPSSSASVTAPVTQRLLSLDALRGFDMFWIVGAEDLVKGLENITNGGPIGLISDQLRHKPWAGMHFEDLIFPLFVFIIGVSIVFSVTKTIEQSGRRGAVIRIVRRFALLYIFGILYYGGLSTPFEKIRLLGVLQRLALCYLFASLLFCYLKPKALVGVCAGLLIGYWALMSFVPVPEHGAGNFAEGANLANYVDKQYLPLRKWDGDHDPEGLLSTLPAIASCLLGVFCGMFLRRDSSVGTTFVTIAGGTVAIMALLYVGVSLSLGFSSGFWQSDKAGSFAIGALLVSIFIGIGMAWYTRSKNLETRKVGALIGAGLLAVTLGWLWHLNFPVIKKIWTSSFVLVAGGYSCLLLAAFYQIIDVWKFQKWATPFIWIGVNPITIYFGGRFIDFEGLAKLIVGGEVNKYFGRYGDLVLALTTLALAFWFLRFLYQRRIFLRV